MRTRAFLNAPFCSVSSVAAVEEDLGVVAGGHGGEAAAADFAAGRFGRFAAGTHLDLFARGDVFGGGDGDDHRGVEHRHAFAFGDVVGGDADRLAFGGRRFDGDVAVGR